VKRLCLLVVVLAILACGKRGDPKPPVPMIPQATNDLLVTQRGPRIVLAWSYPSVTTAGKKLGPIKGVTVYRYSEPLPVPQGGRDPNAILPGDTDPTKPRAISDFSKVPQLTAGQFNKLKTKVDSIEGASLPAATNGAKLTFEDNPPFETSDKRPVRLTYGVVTEGESATGGMSNLAFIIPLMPPSAPADLKAEPKPEGVALSWAKSGSGEPIGYNVYRTPVGESFNELSMPVNPAPVAKTDYLDVPPYGNFEYRVTAVAMAGPPRIESEISPAVTATFKDLQPPPAPTGLTALIETGAVRLVWDPVDVPDLRGYLVFRNEAGQKELFLSKDTIPQTTFTDISIQPGVEYTYDVVAVDKSWNYSAHAKTKPVIVPKTP